MSAGLMIRSYYRLQQVDSGFNGDHLLTFNITLPQKKYPDDPQKINFYEQVADKLRTLPGVETVGLSSGLPLGNNGWQTSFVVDGAPPPEPGKTPITDATVASPDYFRAMGIVILKGRNFTEQDTKEVPHVALIDEEFARRYWPGEEAVGKHIRPGGNDPNNPLAEVIGVVRRVKMEGLNHESDRVQAYFPFRQLPNNGMTVTIKTGGDPMNIAAAVREQVLTLDSDQPIYNLYSMQQLRADSIAPERLNLMLFTCFAVVALLLASVGIYGVMSYSVTQRTHEIGIRMALGAQPRNVLGMVVRQGMILTVTGLALGIGVALLATQLMASLLFSVSATDPLTFIAIPLLLAGVALGACFVPARRATKVDPLVALRYE
jgi:putative ABC transport system permease protein